MTHDPNASSNPTRSAGPASPTVVTAERLAAGNIRLRWTGPVGDGTRYRIWRQLDGKRSFTQIGCEVDGAIGGGAGLEANTFTDTNVSAGAKSVSYYIETQRADDSPPGKSDMVTVDLPASEAA